MEEVVCNSVDEAVAGFCENISVKINLDGSLTVIDDGRGIPVDTHAETKKSALEVVMTMLHVEESSSIRAIRFPAVCIGWCIGCKMHSASGRKWR